jgi:hypothetical protein
VLDRFREVVICDFEFEAPPGERPKPVAATVWELRSGRRLQLFEGQFGSAPPWATGPDVLFIAYYSTAEANCFRVLGWPIPERCLDLFTEFRNVTNGMLVPCGNNLLGALAYFGLDTHGADEKKAIQEAIGNGTWRGVYTPEQILDYNQRDVGCTVRLLRPLLPKIDWPRALLRGRYMVSGASAIESNGIPIDTPTLTMLREQWEGIQDDLIAAIDQDYGVFEGRSFRGDRFADYLARNRIPWPRHDSGALDLRDQTFKEIAKSNVRIAPLRELRHALSQLRLNSLRVGRDGRNRPKILSAFRSITSRNQPSSAGYIYGPSVWLRSLIKPPPGHALIHTDWSSAEFGIGAALSGDLNMQRAYRSGDPYLALARQAGAVPDGATKDSHSDIRDLYKTCALGVQYGMGERSLALRIDRPLWVARDLIRAHREAYPKFWKWSDAAVDTFMLKGSLQTVFGWTIHLSEDVNSRSIRNFPMQANCAEAMRIAACLMAERGIPVGGVAHDAFSICTPLENAETDAAAARDCMREASRAVLNFELGVDVKIICYPGRYSDRRGKVMWAKVGQLLERAGLRRASNG